MMTTVCFNSCRTPHVFRQRWGEAKANTQIETDREIPEGGTYVSHAIVVRPLTMRPREDGH